jgi:hypothetical protein
LVNSDDAVCVVNDEFWIMGKLDCRIYQAVPDL